MPTYHNWSMKFIEPPLSFLEITLMTLDLVGRPEFKEGKVVWFVSGETTAMLIKILSIRETTFDALTEDETHMSGYKNSREAYEDFRTNRPELQMTDLICLVQCAAYTDPFSGDDKPMVFQDRSPSPTPKSFDA